MMPVFPTLGEGEYFTMPEDFSKNLPKNSEKLQKFKIGNNSSDF